MKVLVIVPTHDRTEFLDECIASIQAQTRAPDEVVITGNVGHPAYPSVYSDAPLEDRLNAAIESTDCDAFVILCDDDVLLPRFIELTLKVMEETEADIVYCTNVTSLYRKRIWAKTPGFRSVGFFDWDFWWSCLEAGAKCVPFGSGLFIYREHPAQVAQHAAWRADGSWARWEAEMYERHPKRGKP
jgi:GT2 family glycosyltransferase